MNNRKTVKLQLRLSEDELQVFKNKSQNYGGNISAMIRDAVSGFDDKKAKGKIGIMIILLNFYKEYQQRLSWLGGIFNQAMHRANELAIAGDLSPYYFQNVIQPKAQEILQFIRDVKLSLDNIHDELEKA